MIPMLKAGAEASSDTSQHRDVTVGGFTGRDALPAGDLGQGPKTTSRNGDTARTKVLIVDDERIIADTLSMILSIAGFEACAVYSGEAAVEALGSFQPDVLLSDVILAGMSGIDTAIAFQTLRPHCKTLLFSGEASAVDLLYNAREQGYSFEIMLKPVHPTDLLAKLQSISVAPNAAVDSPTGDGCSPNRSQANGEARGRA